MPDPDTLETVQLHEIPYDHPHAVELVDELMVDLAERYGSGDETPIDAQHFAPPDGLFVVVSVGGELAACAGLRVHDDTSLELKRMYVRPGHRRQGLARRVLRALEDRTRASGRTRLVLETGRMQPEAIALYESCGYHPIPGFGHYKDAPGNRCYAKEL